MENMFQVGETQQTMYQSAAKEKEYLKLKLQ